MESLRKINGVLEKIMPIITPLSLLIGVLLGSRMEPYAFLSPWIFAFMTFSGSLGSNFRDLVKVVTRPIPMLVNLLILHVLMPLVAWGVGSLLYPNDINTITGFILAAVIPTGITSFIWVSIYGGHIALTLSIILIDTLLSPFIVPYCLYLLLGAEVSIDIWALTEGLFYMIVLPSLIGMCLNQFTGGKVKKTLAPRLAPFSKLALAMVVVINSSVVSPYLSNVSSGLIGMAALVLLLASLGYIIGWVVSKMFRWNRDVVVTLTYNSGMRNIGAGGVLAVAYFPPSVALPVVLGMLFQQTLASFFGAMLKMVYSKKEKEQLPISQNAAS